MRKSIFGVLAAALLLNINGLFAQEQPEAQLLEPSKTEFAPHWFMQIQGGAAHTLGEAEFDKLLSPTAALNFGRQFTPAFALRFGLSGWQAKGGWVNNPKADYKFNYVQGNIDVMLHLSHLIGGFKPERTFNFYGFLGAGYNYAFNNDEAVDLAAQGAGLGYLWNDNKSFIVGRGGLGVDIRLSDGVDLNIEGNANTLSDKFNSKKAGNTDWQFNALVGLKIKFGKGYTKTAPVYYTPVPVPAPAPKAEPQAEETVAQAPKQVAPVATPKEEEVKKAEPMTQNIFFTIGRSTIRPDQQEKIEALTAYMQEHPESKVQITGYADKQTGTARINERLSKERARVVAEQLEAAGIVSERITIDAKGDLVQPFTTNHENRVSICIAE